MYQGTIDYILKGQRGRERLCLFILFSSLHLRSILSAFLLARTEVGELVSNIMDKGNQ